MNTLLTRKGRNAKLPQLVTGLLILNAMNHAHCKHDLGKLSKFWWIGWFCWIGWFWWIGWFLVKLVIPVNLVILVIPVNMADNFAHEYDDDDSLWRCLCWLWADRYIKLSFCCGLNPLNPPMVLLSFEQGVEGVQLCSVCEIMQQYRQVMQNKTNIFYLRLETKNVICEIMR